MEYCDVPQIFCALIDFFDCGVRPLVPMYSQSDLSCSASSKSKMTLRCVFVSIAAPAPTPRCSHNFKVGSHESTTLSQYGAQLILGQGSCHRTWHITIARMVQVDKRSKRHTCQNLPHTSACLPSFSSTSQKAQISDPMPRDPRSDNCMFRIFRLVTASAVESSEFLLKPDLDV